MSAVLVTGGAGFIGSHVCETLLQTVDLVVAIDDFNPYYDPNQKRRNIARIADHPRFRLEVGSFLDSDVVRSLFEKYKISNVIHLGGYAGVRSSIQRPAIYYSTNVMGTLSLLEFAREYPVSRFVFASSSTVYGRGAEAPFREDSPLGAPLNPYGATKQAAEALCDVYWRLHGVPTVCLRFFNVYGERLRPDLALSIFSKAILRNESIPLFGDGSLKRDFTYVADVVAGLIASLRVESSIGQAINLGNDDPIEMRQLIETLGKVAGKSTRVEYLPSRSEDMPFTHADISKARRLLGYEPQVDIEDGVRRYYDWLRESLS